jgi:hypothetical protein
MKRPAEVLPIFLLGSLVLVTTLRAETVKENETEDPKMITISVEELEGLHGSAPKTEVPLPMFEARNTANESRGPTDLVGIPTVVWFFPFAATPG